MDVDCSGVAQKLSHKRGPLIHHLKVRIETSSPRITVSLLFNDRGLLQEDSGVVLLILFIGRNCGGEGKI